MIKQTLASFTVKASLLILALLLFVSFAGASYQNQSLSEASRELYLCNYLGHSEIINNQGIIYFECFGTLDQDTTITSVYKSLVVFSNKEFFVIDGRRY